MMETICLVLGYLLVGFLASFFFMRFSVFKWFDGFVLHEIQKMPSEMTDQELNRYLNSNDAGGNTFPYLFLLLAWPLALVVLVLFGVVFGIIGLVFHTGVWYTKFLSRFVKRTL